ncbi:hypothetical protein M9Y10_039636 [Tritrichomonas musculus]|uniref:Uncharacterized protein n=1 Tax=Tritrichomonas musculus TaxID=1915356 RepID=A0ABR2GQW0_9EUKA
MRNPQKDLDENQKLNSTSNSNEFFNLAKASQTKLSNLMKIMRNSQTIPQISQYATVSKAEFLALAFILSFICMSF